MTNSYSPQFSIKTNSLVKSKTIWIKQKIQHVNEKRVSNKKLKLLFSVVKSITPDYNMSVVKSNHILL